MIEPVISLCSSISYMCVGETSYGKVSLYCGYGRVAAITTAQKVCSRTVIGHGSLISISLSRPVGTWDYPPCRHLGLSCVFIHIV